MQRQAIQTNKTHPPPFFALFKAYAPESLDKIGEQ